ncbi:MAG: hypothetical protein SFU99_14385 [Saprospiraceae bacterium]|nr:hypothetical protein [Saprospiraceae bacterium]
MKTTLLIIFILILNHSGIAQIEDLLTNPDIEWIGEVELEYNFEPELLTVLGMSENFLSENREYNYTVRKNNFDYCKSAGSINELMINLAENGELPVYVSSAEVERISDEDLQTFFYLIDTLSIAYLDHRTAIKYKINAEIITSYFVKQIYYYDHKKQILTNRVLGVSLVIDDYDENGNKKYKRVLCYMAFPKVNEKQYDINLPEVLFTMETSEYVNKNAFKTLKGDMNKTFEQVFFQLPKQRKTAIYSTETGRCCKEIIDTEEHNKIFNYSVDTIISYHPETYEQTIKTTENPKLGFNLYSNEYKLIQTWYFDAETNQLVSRLEAAAPALDVLDENGNFLFIQSLFYLCFSNNIPTGRSKG